MILPVILAGGSGTRLWPLSRSHYPKQFLSLFDNSSLLQNTMERIRNLPHMLPLIICNHDHRFIVAEQLHAHKIENSGIILEPIGRNTAPAVALAALKAISDGGDPLLLILAADHVIQNENELLKTITDACQFALEGKLVTFGIKPNEPQTGYGYIKRGSKNGISYSIDSFIEKPDLATAQYYLDSGDYYWNSGMFLFRASRYLEELDKFEPELLANCKLALDGMHKDLDFIRLDEQVFSACKDISIDYAVMERTKDAVVLQLDANWSDVGSWSALWDISEKDDNGNYIKGDVITHDTIDSFVYSQDRLVTTVGVKNLAVIETKDAMLVADITKVQNVKEIVSKLKRENRSEYIYHRESYSPWGSHDSIAKGERYHVKHIMVKPGHKTATQLHYHRAEHWIVVSGTAIVHKDKEKIILTENEAIYIPIAIPHALENVGKIPLKIIEIRSGNYLGDDDVVRYRV